MVDLLHAFLRERFEHAFTVDELISLARDWKVKDSRGVEEALHILVLQKKVDFLVDPETLSNNYFWLCG